MAVVSHGADQVTEMAMLLVQVGHSCVWPGVIM